VSLTSQLEPEANSAFTNVRSMIKLVPDLEKVGFVTEFNSTRSSAAKLSCWFGGAPLRSTGIKVAGNYGRAIFPGVFSNLFDIAWGRLKLGGR